MIAKTHICWLLLVLATSVANAEDFLTVEQLGLMMNNVSSEYAQCTAYYAHTASAMKNADDIETSDRYAGVYEDTMLLAVTAALSKRSQEMALKVSQSRFNIFLDQMTDEIDKNYSNFSILMDKYHYRCDFVLNKTDEFLTEKKSEALKG